MSWMPRMPVSDPMWIIEPPPCARLGPDEGRAGRRRDRGAALLAPSGEGDGHALRAQPLDGGLADSGGAAGDERDPPPQPVPRHVFSTAPERSDARIPPST